MKQIFRTFFVLALVLVFTKGLATADEDAATPNQFKNPGTGKWITGNPERGRLMFYHPEGAAPCFKCHTIQDQGGKVGPNLTNIGATRSAGFIIESLLKPSAVIAQGFEAIKLETLGGELITGMKAGASDTEIKIKLSTGEIKAISVDQLKGGKYAANTKMFIKTFGGKVKGWFLEETDDTVELMNLAGTEKISVPKNTIISRIKLKKKIDGKKKIEGYIKAKDEENITVVKKKDKKEVVISREDIKKIRWGYTAPKAKSTMPGNFRDLLSVQNVHDIVTYLKSIAPPEEATN